MPNYQNGKIYKINDLSNGNCYVGSTCRMLSKRLDGHKSNYKSFLNGSFHFISSFKIIENDNFDIELIENFPCNSKGELDKQERFWTNHFDCVNLRKNQGIVAEIGFEDYQKLRNKNNYQLNKQAICERTSKYYFENKEYLTFKNQCNCGGFFTNINKSNHLKTKMHISFYQ